MAETIYAHRQLIAEEGIDVKAMNSKFKTGTWPSIRTTLAYLEKDISKAGDNPPKSELDELKKRSIVLSDQITDFLEEDLPDAPETTNLKQKQMEKEKLEKILAATKEAEAKENWEGAKAEYSKGLEIDTENAECKAGIANCDAKIAEAKEADTKAKEAKEKEEKAATANAATEKKEKEQTEAAEKNKKNFEGLIATGDAAFSAKKYADAKEAYTAALKIYPEDAIAIDKLAQTESVLEKEKQEKAKPKQNVVQSALSDYGLNL